MSSLAHYIAIGNNANTIIAHRIIITDSPNVKLALANVIQNNANVTTTHDIVIGAFDIASNRGASVK